MRQAPVDGLPACTAPAPRPGVRMIVGYTGSSRGMSDFQKGRLRALLLSLGATELHHGDCIGGDSEAHDVARWLGLRVVVHPPDNDKHRAFCEADDLREPKQCLVRNMNIVLEVEHVLAAPLITDHEVLRAGTWATIRYCRQKKRAHTILDREPAEGL